MRISGLRNFTRAVIASAAAATGEDPVSIATARWGPESGAVSVLRSPSVIKTAVGGLTSTSPMSAAGAGDDQFFASVIEASLIGRLQPRLVPFMIRTLRMTSSTHGYWVGQSKPIPLSKPAMTGSTLERRKVGALMVVTKESLETANPLAEDRLEEDMRNALVGALDEAFIDAGNAGVANEMPAAVTNGAPASASSGNPGTDIANLIAAFAGDLSQAMFVTDPLTAAQIALARDASGGFAFPDAGPRGGSLLTVPLLVSKGSPRTSDGGQLALIDPSGIAANVEAIEVARSTAATLEMADDPTGASDTPTAQSTTQVSMFQTESVALRATIHGNWEVQRPAVAVITGIDYPTEAP